MFDIRLSKANKLYFVVLARNNKVILTSEEYESHGGMVNGIKSVQTNSQLDGAYQKFRGKDGQYYFNLRAKNNRLLVLVRDIKPSGVD